jgi:hypothetical protein
MLTIKRKAQLMIVATYLLGLIVGASGHYLLTGQSIVKQASLSESIVSEIARAVQLDANQRIQVERIVNETHQQYEELRIHLRTQHNSIRDTCRQRIRALLSLEQRLLYDQWIQELDAKREQKAREAEAARNAR